MDECGSISMTAPEYSSLRSSIKNPLRLDFGVNDHAHFDENPLHDTAKKYVPLGIPSIAKAPSSSDLVDNADEEDPIWRDLTSHPDIGVLVIELVIFPLIFPILSICPEMPRQLVKI